MRNICGNASPPVPITHSRQVKEIHNVKLRIKQE